MTLEKALNRSETLHTTVSVEDLFNTALDFYNDVVIPRFKDGDEDGARYALTQVLGILSSITALTGTDKEEVADMFDSMCYSYKIPSPQFTLRMALTGSPISPI